MYLIFLGASLSGKTSILKVISGTTLKKGLQMTLGIEMIKVASDYLIDTGDFTISKYIIDTTMTPHMILNIVYDCTSKTSYETAFKIIQEYKDKFPRPVIYVWENKIDLPCIHYHIDPDHAYIKKIFKVSAKTTENIRESFEQIQSDLHPSLGSGSGSESPAPSIRDCYCF
jgi:GTPase SAR1 family protein